MNLYEELKQNRENALREQIKHYTQSAIDSYCKENHIDDVSIEGIINHTEAVIFAAKERQMRLWAEKNGIDVDEHCRKNDITVEQLIQVADIIHHVDIHEQTDFI